MREYERIRISEGKTEIEIEIERNREGGRRVILLFNRDIMMACLLLVYLVLTT